MLLLLGYLPKRRTPAPAWLDNPTVEEICSVSECMASAPPGWIDCWVHNDFGFCNSVEKALSLVPPGDDSYALYAFEILPLRFSKGGTSELTIDHPLDRDQHLFEPVNPEPLSSGFLPLGFDVASNTVTPFFECSPLSCNNMAASVVVNRHCLIDELSMARSIALRFSLEEPEPGDYFVLQVLRRSP
jgi:hypothetical protein